MGQFISTKTNVKPNDKNGLILYYHPFSYYSQKVLFVLKEKNIDCTLHEVDVTNGEQCSNWFMQMNPKIDVPVLQNETMIVPSSNQIINYLEVNYNDEIHVTLLPMDDVKLRKKIILFHRRISQIPVGIISVGSIIHSQLVCRPKIPFIGPLRNGILKSENEMLEKLERYADQNPLHRDSLLYKVKFQREKYELIRNIDEYQKLVDAVNYLLTDIEDELQYQFAISNEWLCCNEFTIADISLGMLLYRLSILGLEKYFWANDKRPFLTKYYRRLAERDSFKQSLPSTKSTLKIVWFKLPYTYKVCTIGFTCAVVGYTIYKI